MNVTVISQDDAATDEMGKEALEKKGDELENEKELETEKPLHTGDGEMVKAMEPDEV